MKLRYLMVGCFFVLTAGNRLAQAQDVCAQATDREQVDCLSQKIDIARKELASVYATALAQLPEYNPTDIRKSRAQLVKSQSAWQAYVSANCAYVGGSEGGSNLSVTNFASRCELQAVQDRVAFLHKEGQQQ
jgi:uncharacterized protein YecT (DUF1311 family)